MFDQLFAITHGVATRLPLAGSNGRRYSKPMSDIRDNPDKHRFEADLGDGSLASAEYDLFPDRIVFTHTVVPPQHEGHGVGSALVRFALKSARERHLKVIPVCPFFAAYIRKHAEEQDLLDPAWREKLGLD